MGKWHPASRAGITDIREKAELLLKDSKAAKSAHKASPQCVMIEGGSPDRQCCGCHFWAGAIAALTDLIQ